MSDQSAVLVLGAGASIPFGFPSGGDLKKALSRALQVPGTALGGHCEGLELVRLLGTDGYSAPECASFGQILARAPQDSIDAFLEHHLGLRGIGRAAIALAIAHCEERARSSIEDSGGGDWLKFLFNRLGNPASWQRGRLVILTYNYDRSLEAWLENACRTGFAMSAVSARAAVGALEIVHVHGSLGPVDTFGTPAEEIALAEISPALSLVFEEVEGSDAYRRSKQAVQSADLVGFLGFGYHRENVGRLRIYHRWPEGPAGGRQGLPPPKKKQLFGTAYKIAPSDIQVIKSAFTVGIQLAEPEQDALAFLRESKFLPRLLEVTEIGR